LEEEEEEEEEEEDELAEEAPPAAGPPRLMFGGFGGRVGFFRLGGDAGGVSSDCPILSLRRRVIASCGRFDGKSQVRKDSKI
jgi:hypothetical protein